MKYALLLLALSGLMSAETFKAVLVKPAWPDREGVLAIYDRGITFTAKETKEGADYLGMKRTGRALDRLADRPKNLSWTWLDIQYFDRISRKEFVVLTYKDDWRFLGRDKEYRFRLTEGELDHALLQRIRRHLNRPVTDRVPPPETVAAGYSIPVKLDGTFGGSEGVLRFTDDAIYYITADADDRRTWLLDRDIKAVWSDDPYRLEIRAYENNRREFSRTATYKFDLKEKLDSEFYRKLKLKLYDLESNNRVLR